MTKNKKENLLNKFEKEFFDINQTFLKDDNDRFNEIATSLAYYLKLFTSLKKLLEYISLISKYIIKQDFSLIIPLDENGQLLTENITYSDEEEFKNIDCKFKNFCEESGLLNNFKIKNINLLDNFFKKNFSTYFFRSYKVVSRGKCRGFFFLFFKNSLQISTYKQERNIDFLLNLLAIGLENYFLSKINKKHENVDREISSGAEIQSRLLPDFCPQIFGVELAAHCRPALKLGGDYYDFMSIKPNVSDKRKQRGRWALVIGDVMGKGIPAGLLMTMLRGMLRAEVLTGLPPDRILHDLNQLAIYDLDQSHRFITLFYSDYDPRTKKLRYANAAHNPPLLWQNEKQQIIKLDADGFVIGLQKNADYQCGEIKLNTSDVILYYTDGITETSNSSGERFGENNLINVFSKLCKKSFTSKQILSQIFKTLDKYSGEKRRLDDDASVVIFKIE